MAWIPDGINRLLFFGATYNGVTWVASTWEYHVMTSSWYSQSPSTTPGVREDYSLATDWVDNYILMFGGVNPGGGYYSDTWEYTHTATGNPTWTQISPSSHPGSRSGASMYYATLGGTHNVYLYGGYDNVNGKHSDTWEYQGGTWSSICSSCNPGARTGTGMAVDSADGYLVLFGGQSSTNSYYGDTYKFTSGASDWTLVCSSCGMAGRWLMQMAWDNQDNKVVMYGGYSSANGGTVYSDTWYYSGGSWTAYSSPNSNGDPPPPARYDSAFYSTSTTPVYLVMFGGGDLHNNNAETWDWGGNLGGSPSIKPIWFKVNTFNTISPSSPSARATAMMEWDGTDGYVLLFGGGTSSGGYLGDTWKFSGGSWTELFDPSSCSGGSCHVCSSSYPCPPARAGAVLAWDKYDGFSILFGGEGSGGTYLTDTWMFPHTCPGSGSGCWYQRGPANTPPARILAVAVGLTTGAQVIVLYGGRDGNTLYHDTWVYTAGQTSLCSTEWCQVTTSTQPGGTNGLWQPMMTEDPDLGNGYLLLYGGSDTASWSGSGAIAETWDFACTSASPSSCDTWTKLAPVNNLGTRYAGYMDFGVPLPGSSSVGTGGALLMGGEDSSGTAQNNAWVFNGYTWTEISTSAISSNGARFSGEMAYDDTSGDVDSFLFGGVSSSGSYLNDDWVYR